jgi:hypothetical protein
MVEQKVKTEHSELVALVEKLLRETEVELKEIEIPVQDSQRVFVAALAQRIHSSSQASLQLIFSGFAAEAQSLARVCLEASFKQVAIARNKQIAMSYVHEHLFFRKKVYSGMLKHLSAHLQSEQTAEINKQLTNIQSEIRTHGVQEKLVVNWAKDSGMAEIYSSAYILHSAFIHSSSTSLKRWLQEDSEHTLTHLIYGPTDFDVETVLITIADCLLLSFKAVGSLFDRQKGDLAIAMDKELNSIVAKYRLSS